MKRNLFKMAVCGVLMIVMLSVCAIGVYAYTATDHQDPTGGTAYYYAFNSSECNRTINVTFQDTSGSFLKKVVIYTKHGEDSSFHIGMGGYDIVKFESNQGLWETCKICWTSGTGLCTEADLWVDYYFRTALSKKELNITVTMRKWDTIEFEVRHYVEKNPNLKFFHRDNYVLHSTTDQKTLNYYDAFTTSKRTITGYTLNTDYQSSVSGNLCFRQMVGSCKNLPSSPRCYEYDFHNTSWSEAMGYYSSYDESKDGKLDWCNNRKIWVEYFYDINEYTVSFNANGGVGAPNALTKYHGYDISIPDTVPTRSGYTFKGWGTSNTSTTASYQPGGNYTANTGRTLYAIWESNAPKTYTVTYNANGGIGAPSSQTKTHNVTLKLSTTEPTRSGYTFVGWATSSSATSATYTAGANYTSNAPITLYAVWLKNISTYTVSYNANGGSNAPASQIKTEGTPLTLTTAQPTRTGYIFLGWSTSPTAISPSYLSGGTYSTDASVTLYAVWQPRTYTISYEANGGSGAPSSQTKSYGTSLTLSSVRPTRSGYTFLGWATSASAISPTYYAGGTFSGNYDLTLYAVWRRNPNVYTISYDANGGSGAPSPQVKTEDIDLTLSTVEPTRFRYTFKGWSTGNTASEPEYLPGDTYTANASTTLYAVWEKDNYEFSVSNLTVVEDQVYRYDTATVKVRADSWDRVNAYDNIPIQLYYDGRLIGTQYANFAAYGVANVTFTVNVGDTPGNHTLEVRINWEDRTYETDSTNNSVSGALTVKDYEYEVSPHPVSVNADYTAGTTVVTSFTVDNDSDFDITPDLNHKIAFTAYYYDGARKVVISTQTWEQAIIPSRGSNLFYFQWTVPNDIAGKTVYCECTANADRALNEENRSNNTVIYTKVVQAPTDSQTPNTRYEANAPVGYYQASVPLTATQTATWNRWEYEGGSFVLKQYGVKLSADIPAITPSNSVSSAYYENGKWVMKSGYGITLSFTPDVTRVTGYSMPDSNAYTPAQSAVAYFPEYCYWADAGKCRILECANGSFQFVVNTDSSGLERLHFVPIYVADGYYVVSVIVSEIWTPAGMITAVRNSVPVVIDGTIYDDFYHGN